MTVQWVVPYLAYTQEQYTVNYGSVRGSLDETSPVLSSTTDLSVSNITYDMSLQGLVPNTVYYFQIHGTNMYGTSASTIMTFTTLEAGMY